MPQVVVAAAAFVAAHGVAYTIGFLIGRTILYVAIAYAIGSVSRMLTKKPSVGAGSLDTGRTVTVREAAASRKMIYGQVRVGGVLVYAGSSGTNKEYMHLVIAHAGHECEEIGTVYLNDEEVPLDGSGNATGKYAGYVTVKKHLGTAAQTVDTDLQSAVGSGEWSNNHRLRGICYSYLRLKHNPDLFPTGIPVYTALVKGKKIYDPRTATTAWSDNAALCLRDYLLDTSLGLGATSGEVNDTAAQAAANVCDEAVDLNPSGTEARYTVNGTVDTATAPGAVIADLLAAMAGVCPYIGGQFYIKAGAHSSSGQTLTLDDARGPIRFATGDSLRDCFNGVKGLFFSEKNNWQPSDFPPVFNSTYTTEDGGERIWRDISLPFTTSSATAQRLAKIELERSRQDITVQFPAKLTALNVQVGDVVALTIARYGWSAKLFEVQDFVFVVDGQDGNNPTLGIDLLLRETASGVWDWNNGEETVVDLAPNTTLADPVSVPAPASFAANVAATAERTALPRVKCTWTAPAREAVLNGGFTEIEYKLDADSDWTSAGRVPGSVLFFYVNDLAPGELYNFRARHVNIHGARGAYSTDNEVAEAGTGTYTALLTNEAHSVSCDAGGTAIAGELGSGGRAFSDVLAFAGSLGLTPVASAPGPGEFAISVATHSGTGSFVKADNDTIYCDTLTTDSAVGRVTIDLEGALTVYKDFTVTKVNSGNDGDPGTDGDDATVYWLVPDAAAVNKTIAGSYTPSTLNLSAYSKTGAAAPAAYSGRFKIATYDGATWTDVYTSAGDESTKAYTVPASILAIRCRLYLAGGTSTLVDEQIVPIVTDGATGATGATGAAGSNGSNGAAVAADNGSFSTIGLNSGGQSTAVTVSKTPVSTSCLVTAACTMENLDAVADSGVTVRVYRDSTVIGAFENFDLAAYETEVGKPLVIADTGLTGGVTYSYTIKCYRTVSGATIDCQSCSLSIVG